MIQQIGKFIKYTKRNAYAWIAFALIVGGSFYDDIYVIGFAMASIPYFWGKIKPIIDKLPGPQG